MANLVPEPSRINNNDAGWSVRTFLNGFLSLLSNAINKLNEFKADKVDIEKIRTPYFQSSTELNKKYPPLVEGSQAWVGDPYPGTVWVVKDGKWIDTGKVPPMKEINLEGYAEKVIVDKLNEKVENTQIYIGIGNIIGRYIKNITDKYEMGYSETWIVSDFMPVFSISLSVSGLSQGGSDSVQWSMFDKDKKFLGVFKPIPNDLLNRNTVYESLIPNDNCKFIKSSIHINDIDTFQCVNEHINSFESNRLIMSNLDAVGELNVYSKLGNTSGYILNNSESLHIGASINWVITDYLPILTPHLKISGVSVLGSDNVQWAMFDKNKQFLGVFKPLLGNSPTETYRHYVTNPLVRFIRASITKADAENFSFICESSNRIDASIADIKNIREFLSDLGIYRETVQSYDYTRNKNGYYIKNNNEGYTEGNETTFSITDYLPIYSKTIEISGLTQAGSDAVQWAKFDKDKKFLGVFKPVQNGLLPANTTYPYIEENKDCAFYRASIHKNNVDTFSLVCKKVNVVKNALISKEDFAKETIQGINPLEYNIPHFVKACRNDWDDFNAKTITLQGFYDKFNHLADAFRTYVTVNEPIGESTLPTGRFFDIDPNIYPINHYTFARVGLSNDAPKLIICAGIHGDSEGEGWLNNGGDKTQSMVCTYYFLKDLCWNYESNPLLKYIHENMRIELIPIMNPWGVQNHSRWNGRGVDLNRNYDNNWNSSVIGGGEAPFSEKESQAFRDFILKNLDAKLCIDIHTRGGDVINNDLRWWGSAYDAEQIEVFDDVVAIMKAKYGGTSDYDRGTPEGSLPTSSSWMNYQAGVHSLLPELVGVLNMNKETINNEDVNRQSTHYLALLIQRGLRAYNVI